MRHQLLLVRDRFLLAYKCCVAVSRFLRSLPKNSLNSIALLRRLRTHSYSFIFDKAIKSNSMVLNISRLFRVKFSYCFFLYCVYLQSLRRSFNTISGKLNRKGLKKGLLVISCNPSTQQFHHDALNAIPEFKKTSLIKVSRTRKIIIHFILCEYSTIFLYD